MKHKEDGLRTLENLLAQDSDKLPFHSGQRHDSKVPKAEPTHQQALPKVSDAQVFQRGQPKVPNHPVFQRAQPERPPNDESFQLGAQPKLVAELGLEFVDLTYTVVKQEKIDGKWESADLEILQGISGKAIKGQLTAIMGPSGAGKSTFLDALAGRIEQRSLGGIVRLDGQQVTGTYIKSNSAYVLQQDFLFPFLTVAETLMFSAEVRLPTKLSRSEKEGYVRALITQLGLEDCDQTYVGDEKHRGISGGEKRRVSIGVDIIHRPSLLFLDEPTSGLDSTSALIVMEKLLDIAAAGSTILLTIHQPSYRIQIMFGCVIILARGNVVYRGAPTELAGYMEALGWRVPKNENDIEYFIEMIKEYEQSDTGIDPLVQLQRDGVKTSVTGKSNLRKSAPSTPMNKDLEDEDGGFDHSLTNLRTPRTRELNLAYNFYTGKPSPNLTFGFSPLRKPLSNSFSVSPLPVNSGFHSTSKKTLSELMQERIASPTPQCPSVEGERLESAQSEAKLFTNSWRYQNGWLREVMILMWRSSKCVIRSPELFISREVKAAGLSILLATLFKDPKRDLEGINHRVAYFVFVVSLILFSCNDALPTFIEERFIFIKETGSKAYRASSYTVASVLVYLPVNALQAVTYVVITWWALKLDGGVRGFLIFSLILFALVVTTNSFAMLVGALVPNFVAGYAFVIGLSALSFFFCGYFIKRSQIPVFWLWLHYMSTLKYALEAALQNEFIIGKCFSTVHILPTPGPLGGTPQFSPLPLPNGTLSDCYMFGEGVIKSLDMPQFTIAEDIAFVLMWGFIYRFLLYIVLRFYSKGQRK